MQWLQNNFATVAVAAVVVVAVVLALFFTLRSRRRGCSCGRGSCPFSANCKNGKK